MKNKKNITNEPDRQLNIKVFLENALNMELNEQGIKIEK